MKNKSMLVVVFLLFITAMTGCDDKQKSAGGETPCEGDECIKPGIVECICTQKCGDDGKYRQECVVKDDCVKPKFAETRCDKEEFVCRGVDCSGHGRCVQSGTDTARCLCDTGFVVVRSDPLSCISIRIRPAPPSPGEPHIPDLPTPELPTCEGFSCGAHSKCEIVSGVPTCQCDLGYLMNPDDNICIKMAGDFDNNGEIDIRDFAVLAENWGSTTSDATTGDIASDERAGTPPYLTPSPDGIVNFRDLFAFTAMWNWYRYEHGLPDEALPDPSTHRP